MTTSRDDSPLLATARSLGEVFALPGACRELGRHGSGHIHDTFVARYASPGGTRRFVHQRLNTHVFPEPEAVMANLVRVTDHLRDRLARRGVPDLERRCLRWVPTRDGASHHVDPTGGVWRTFHFVEGARSHDQVEGPDQAFRAARAFGEFLALLADLDPVELAVPIAHFHDLARRRAHFEEVSSADPLGRAAGAREEIDRYARACAQLADELAREGEAELPRRVVHNDCKLNNVLLDERTGEALCVIDLDTAMQGTLLYDFGDLVRTASCRAPEDALDLEAVRVDLELFEALARGYLAGAGGALAPLERELLPWAGARLTLETGLRFLTDHLEDDRYFRVHRPGHNLDRARAQLQLLDSLRSQQAELGRLVRVAVG